MDLKGLKLNIQQIRLLDKSIDKMSPKTLRGIPAFTSFSWSGFSKVEFANLVTLANNCILPLFKGFGDKHSFVFNFSAGFLEMDIVTVASLNGQPILIDIESKNGNDENLRDKLRRQIGQRKDELPRLTKGRAYLVLGFVNNEFVDGVFFDGKQTCRLSFWADVANQCLSLKPFLEVEYFLTQISTIAGITEIVPKMEKGKYQYFPDTDEHYRDMVTKIGKINALIVSGRAGTGKTVLAVRLFLEQRNTKFLLVNSKLYFSLWIGRKYYSQKRATFNSEDFLSWISGGDTISVVDEYQRLPLQDIVDIIRNSKTTFLFGDCKQAFEERSTAMNPEELRNALIRDYDFSVEVKKLSKAKRYCDEVERALGFLTSQNGPKGKAVFLPLGYSINLYYDDRDFLKRYNEVEGIKKIFVPLNQADADEIVIGGEKFKKALWSNDSFSALDDWHNAFGLTYHALSFDVDHCFVFLNKIHLLRRGRGEVMFYHEQCTKSDQGQIDLFLNELNVLFTRGKKSLNIFVNDIAVYFYLSQRLSGSVTRSRCKKKTK